MTHEQECAYLYSQALLEQTMRNAVLMLDSEDASSEVAAVVKMLRTSIKKARTALAFVEAK